MKTNHGVLKLIYCIIFLSVITLVLLFGCNSFDAKVNSRTRIIVELQQPSDITKLGNLEMNVHRIKDIDTKSFSKPAKGRMMNGYARWEIYSEEPVQLLLPTGRLNLVMPGDSIHIDLNGKYPVYSGKGYEKLTLWSQLLELEDKLEKPAKVSLATKSIDEYLKWNEYLDQKIALQMPAIDSFKQQLRPFERQFIKTSIVYRAEADRLNSFISLEEYINKADTTSNETFKNLNAIWDTTQHKTWSRWLMSLSTYYGSMNAFYAFNKLQVQRRFNFDFKTDSLNSKDTRTYLYYQNSKRKFTGDLRERLMVFILNEPVLVEMGVKNPMTQAMLQDYYKQPGYPEYKEMIRSIERHRR